MANKKKLRNIDVGELNFAEETRLFLNDSLCPYYRGIYGKCKRLLEAKKISSFWTWNGNIKIKLDESSRPINITHDVDLYSRFDDFRFFE